MSEAERDTITLKGSTATVTEFFSCALSSILYQRGVYPPENFEPRKKYGLTIMAVKDAKLKEYLGTVLKQFEEWLSTGTIQKAVLVITSAETRTVLERWAFDIRTDGVAARPAAKEAPHGDENSGEGARSNASSAPGGGRGGEEGPASGKSTAAVAGEIQAIIRQITASVTFLPLLSGRCAIDLLAYTDVTSTVPTEWEESDPRHVKNGSSVQLRSFDTSIHKIDTLVSYAIDDGA